MCIILFIHFLRTGAYLTTLLQKRPELISCHTRHIYTEGKMYLSSESNGFPKRHDFLVIPDCRAFRPTEKYRSVSHYKSVTVKIQSIGLRSLREEGQAAVVGGIMCMCVVSIYRKVKKKKMRVWMMVASGRYGVSLLQKELEVIV